VLPELLSLDQRRHLVRIPHELDVPLTPRVVQLIDTPEFRRLTRISQLGLVTLVYPGATHSRFEHSLGVYRNALLYLKQLNGDERFTSLVSEKDAEVFLVAALLHDLGHWPFCHPIEDIRLPGVPHHELFANSFLLEGELADVLRQEWQLNPRDVVAFLSEKPREARGRLLASLLSGPIDIDKMDYLVRDSLHAGVPYGRHFDQQRLIGSMCLNEAGDGLAITEKGRTAAEMMVFARYVMFNEVYWHHAVRSATAMLQRAFSLLQPELELDALFRLPESAFIDALLAAGAGTSAEPLLAGLFGPARRLYKRLAEFSFFQHRELYEQIARRPFPWLAALAEKLAEGLSRRLARRVAPHEVLVDAPPVKREIEFSVDVYFPKEKLYRPLGDVSPAIHTLATRQFDDFVKRVRIFLHPDLIADARQIADTQPLVAEALDGMK
jgi:HD superfamily phosphohydrolase